MTSESIRTAALASFREDYLPTLNVTGVSPEVMEEIQGAYLHGWINGGIHMSEENQRAIESALDALVLDEALSDY